MSYEDDQDELMDSAIHEMQTLNEQLRAENERLQSRNGRMVSILDRFYKAWQREGWEEGREKIVDVLGDAAWEIYDMDGAPLVKKDRPE